MQSATHIAIPLAFSAGLISFLSPCVLPLVPGYISAIAGARDTSEIKARNVIGPTLAFIGSFSCIFITLSLLAGRAIRGAFVGQTAMHVCGAIIIVMGIVFIASPFIPQFAREYHIPKLMQRAGNGGPVLVGAAFAIAWTPCIGPTLGTIITLSATAHSAGKGAFLMAIYCLGLGVPFLITGLAFGKATTALNVVKRHYPIVIGVGGVILIGMGVLIFTGEFTTLNIQVSSALHTLHLPNLSNHT